MSETSSSPDISFGNSTSRSSDNLFVSMMFEDIRLNMIESMSLNACISTDINNGTGIDCMFLIGNFNWTAPTVPLLIDSTPIFERRNNSRYSGVMPLRFVSFTQFSVKLALFKVSSTIAVKPIVPTIDTRTSPAEVIYRAMDFCVSSSTYS